MSLGKFGKIAVGWAIITFSGVSAFVLSKNSIDKHRYESMQVRDRMKKSNIGEYEAVGSRRFTA
ncbi:uncharacterized protein LOC119679057 [Teleopsis dalmanni]|uniref:uncharacterized protein LOC119679057 n=1 Tax=Teleopsis dalmanni TaxID=139649 RepID=UPI0018CF8B0C|nr:uncharacterized protein LOC119679057 [Teleopsis dalmanni]